jgi:hypothetical protein
MAAALREVARREPLPASGFDARMVAEVRGGVEAQALVVAERDRLLWRLRPVDAVQRALERPALAWAGKPARRAWSAARRRVGR